MVYKNLIHISILSFTLLCASCDEAPNLSKVSQVDEERIRKIGKKATDKLLTTLQKALKSTITDQGMLSALSVCNIKAIYLTDSISQSTDNIIEIKRTSYRYRNIENAPDTGERNALSYFQSALLKTGHLPDDLIEQVSIDSITHFRYYKPLMIKPLCLNCHGQSDNIAPDISYHLKKLYPRDLATGYKIDQFRGLIRVSIK